MTKEAIKEFSRCDKVLARLIAKVGPCTMEVKSRRTPFQALVRAVTYQQVDERRSERNQSIIAAGRQKRRQPVILTEILK
jgi:3-methyladenine DNA glycosylase/8-oxoguanine DNA glycosylase